MTPPPPPPPPAPPLPAANRAALGLILVAIVAVVGGVFLLTPGEDDDAPSADDFLPPSTAPTTTTGAASAASPTTAAASPAGGATPEATVEAYLDAVVSVDCEAMVSLLTEDRWPGGDRAAAVEECKTTAGTDPEMAAAMSDVELGAPDEQDGVVTIDAHGELGGTPLLLTFTLAPAGDTWLIERIG